MSNKNSTIEYIAEEVNEGFDDVVKELKAIRVTLIKGFIGVVCVMGLCVMMLVQ